MDTKTLAEKLNGNYTKGQIDGELIKYLVIPGHVRAADGDIHFISAEMLIDLYRVDPSRCVIYDANLAKKIGTGAYWRVNEKIFSNLIMLKPKSNGNYTNTIEGAFGHFKRAIVGVYHHASDKHIGRYTEMFAWRWNRREMSEGERVNSLLKSTQGRKLTYKALIAK